jgi:uncharacterized protein YciI
MPLFVRTLLVTGPAQDVELASRGHEEQLRELHARGKLRAAGRFKAGDGYLEIFEAADRLEAEAIGRSSPLIEDGLGSWMLREWVECEF